MNDVRYESTCSRLNASKSPMSEMHLEHLPYFKLIMMPFYRLQRIRDNQWHDLWLRLACRFLR